MSRQEIDHVHDPILLMVPISFSSLSVSSFPGKINAHTQRNVEKMQGERLFLSTTKCHVIFEYRTRLLV